MRLNTLDVSDMIFYLFVYITTVFGYVWDKTNEICTINFHACSLKFISSTNLKNKAKKEQ